VRIRALAARHEASTDAELLVPRHENAVLRRQAGRVCYRSADRLWLAALSKLIPRRWGEQPPTPLFKTRGGAVAEQLASFRHGRAGHRVGRLIPSPNSSLRELCLQSARSARR
jgi:hypothetical protein